MGYNMFETKKRKLFWAVFYTVVFFVFGITEGYEWLFLVTALLLAGAGVATLFSAFVICSHFLSWRRGEFKSRHPDNLAYDKQHVKIASAYLTGCLVTLLIIKLTIYLE